MSTNENLTHCKNCNKLYNIEDSDSDDAYEDYCSALCESEARQQELDDKEARETDRENLRDIQRGSF